MHSNSPLKYVFWNILGTSYLPLYLLCIDYQVLRHNLVLFGGNCQVRTYCGQTLLCHCWCCRRSGCDKRLHRHEQRGAGCQEEDHDDCRCMYLPRGSSTGIAIVLRCDQLTSESYSVHIQ